jgi:hypothetical protein
VSSGGVQASTGGTAGPAAGPAVAAPQAPAGGPTAGSGEPAPPADSPAPPGTAHAASVVPLLPLLAVVVAGLVLAMTSDWRMGTVVCGLAALAAAAARLSLPSAQVGALAVRSRVFDTVVLGALGAGIVALALSLP